MNGWIVVPLVLAAVVVLLMLIAATLRLVAKAGNKRSAKRRKQTDDANMAQRVLEQLDGDVIDDPEVVKFLTSHDAVYWDGKELHTYDNGDVHDIGERLHKEES